ncbi:MAG: chromate resistance protein [Dehalococcoidia bacterium]
MKWVTRSRPMVDRIACPWLIRRFVDPDAEFLYVPADQVQDVAEREGATPFDILGPPGHHDDKCSFDAIIDYYQVTDPAVRRLALIVRGADTDAHDLTPQSPGLLAIAGGFRLTSTDDHEQLERHCWSTTPLCLSAKRNKKRADLTGRCGGDSVGAGAPTHNERAGAPTGNDRAGQAIGHAARVRDAVFPPVLWLGLGVTPTPVSGRRRAESTAVTLDQPARAPDPPIGAE